MGIEEDMMSNGGIQNALTIYEKEEDEVMIRRMKNRERQRRYRERKRMREEEAGIDENLSFETTELQHQEEEELECSGYVENFVRRVYCVRDWKKEARKAHLIREGSFESVKPRRRDWKGEARKKKT